MKRSGAVAAPPCKKRPPGHSQDTWAVRRPFTLMMRRTAMNLPAAGDQLTEGCELLLMIILTSPLYMVTGIMGIAGPRHSRWSRCCCSCCRCCSHSRSSSCWTDSRRAARSCRQTTVTDHSLWPEVISGRYTVSGPLLAARSVYGFPHRSCRPTRP